MKKYKEYKDLLIQDIELKGKGVGRSDGKVIFVEKALPGEIVDVRVIRNKKQYAEAVPVDFKNKSTDRIEPVCQHFGTCGGCKWQHINYEKQLEFKQYFVQTAFERIGEFDFPELMEILGCKETLFYRNKLEFSFSNKRWLTNDEIKSEAEFDRDALGFHKPGGHDQIVDVEKCFLQKDPSNELRLLIKRVAKELGISFYDIRNKEGLLRSLFVRTTELGEIMIILVVQEMNDLVKSLLGEVEKALPNINSINYIINNKFNDSIGDLEVVNFSGNAFIIEQLGTLKFKIGPKSFFQTNSRQAKVLYDVIKDFADLKGDENVYDLYTGIGSIAMYLADSAKKVVGIECLEEAVMDAYTNAQLNGIDNCSFVAGDVKDLLNEGFTKTYGTADLLVVDPPRSGLHPNVVKFLSQSKIPIIIYVSCNPTTQARDLNVLTENYRIEKVQPVDMFPHTIHIENVVLLRHN